MLRNRMLILCNSRGIVYYCSCSEEMSEIEGDCFICGCTELLFLRV